MIKERKVAHTFIHHNIGEEQKNRGDCVTRAIARASGIPYYIVYEDLAEYCRRDPARRGSPAGGIAGGTSDFRLWMKEYGFDWYPAYTGFRIDDIPAIGRYVVPVRKHFTAVVEGRLYDTHDPRKRPGRDVVRGGFWLFMGAKLSK